MNHASLRSVSLRLAIACVIGGAIIFYTSRLRPSRNMPDLSQALRISIKSDKEIYKQMEPVFLDVTYQNTGQEEFELAWPISPRFLARTPSNVQLSKTDYAKNQEAYEEKSFSQSGFNGTTPIPERIKPGGSYTKRFLLNSWCDLTSVGAMSTQLDKVTFYVRCQEFGASSAEIMIHFSGDCALSQCR